jgi:hypothetical protein
VPEANQFLFKNKELLEILVKQAGVHEGRWALMAVFNFGAANVGPSPDQLTPGAIVGLAQLGIQRAVAETPVEITVDAAEVNPTSST